MSSLHDTILVSVILVSLQVGFVSCSGYSLICTTGSVETITFTETGGISFDSGDSLSNGTGEDGLWNYDTNSTNSTNNEGNTTNYWYIPQTTGTGTGSTGGGRSLRRSFDNFDGSEAFLQQFSPNLATPALPWMRHTQEEQYDGTLLLDTQNTDTSSWTSSSGSQEPDTTPQFRVRPCLCHPNNVDSDFYAPNQTVPDFYLCPASSDYCGIPFPGEGTVGCFSFSVQQVVARNAWPLIMLWYFGMLVICCCTVHGNNSWEYVQTFWDSQHNTANVERLVSQNSTNLQPPRSYWNWWAWQKYRLEQNLVAQSRWMWRQQEFARLQQSREQGLPPPRYEMKTKRYARDPQDILEHFGDGDDDNSLHEPTCTICFVPLEDGDLVGDLSCQHAFHKSCLKSWCSRKNACPLCNVPFAKRLADTQQTEDGLTTTESQSTTSQADSQDTTIQDGQSTQNLS